MSAQPPGRFIAVGALALTACCVLPALVGSGMAASLAELWFGNGLLAVGGLLLAGLVGFRWWRRRACPMPTGAGRTRLSGPGDEEERGHAEPH
jgi:hypothetical protein